MKFLKQPCPNCQSAEDLGIEADACLVCADPKTGKTRGWVWRWAWFHRKFVTEKNFRKFLWKGGQNENASRT